jgi:hypothetical protein
MKKSLPDSLYLKDCFKYFPETGDLVWKKRPREHFSSESGMKNFNAQFAGKVAGAIRENRYVEVRLMNDKYRAHRVIFKMMTGLDPEEEIDHINNNPIDNRWENLRASSSSQNNCNQRIKSTNTTGFKCVRWHKRDKKFYSKIKLQGKSVFLGYFDTAEEAYKNYCEKVVFIHGEFSNVG